MRSGRRRVVLAEGRLSYIDVTRLHGSIEQDLKRRDYTVDALAVPLGSTEVIDVTGGLADLRAGTVRMTSAAVLAADPVRPLRGARIAAELGFHLRRIRPARSARADVPAPRPTAAATNWRASSR
jgi:tRNA nucleotidyltransferase/poly(A) polymerase